MDVCARLCEVGFSLTKEVPVIHVTVDGNAGSKPELRDTKSGKAMTRFSVASTTKPKDGESKTSWVTVLAFDQLAQQLAENVNKGDRVLVTGRLEVEEYTDKDGNKRTAVTLLADDAGLSLRWPKRNAAPAQSDEEWSSPF
jgi:single-strand DNA-binding protein